MRLVLRVISAAFACLVAIAAASGGQRPAPGGLRVLDSVRVQESDTLFVSRPSQLVLGARGHVYLTESPVVRRRGIPPGFFETLLQDPAKATPAMVYDWSSPVALAPVSGDIVAIVTMDVKVAGDAWSGVHYITLYDHRPNRVCADVQVPASHLYVSLMKDPLPIVAIRGDTLALLEQAENQAGDPVQLLRRYRIEASQCDWNAIAR